MAGTTQEQTVTRRIFIRGMVQGVGMRPFLALLAAEFGIAGTVKNIGSDVEIVAIAEPDRINGFLDAIRARKPEMAEITKIDVYEIADVGAGRRTRPDTAPFTIVPSSPGDVMMLPADFPVCADCARELYDPANRRYRHPFISCAVCGPRYSIISSAPYDRCSTSMDEFPMCPDCAREYADPADRRYHAQTVSCHRCGPHLIYTDRSGSVDREDALARAAKALKSGGIVAIKGVGGYHLACSPTDEVAVRRLRALKGREQKPFAVMFRDTGALQRRCLLTQDEERLLLSPARPIVLLETVGQPFAPSVAGDARLTGAFLPYTPLQMLLLDQCGDLVMTSANRSGKPEIHEDAEMLAMLAHDGLDGVLYNGRRIVTRLDDSVARISAGVRQTIRRARGFAPRPLALKLRGNEDIEHADDRRDTDHRQERAGTEPRPYREPSQILAYGGDLKSAFCILRGSDAYMSQYFGDMEEREVQEAYRKNLEHMGRLFNFKPDLAVCDLHPGYHSSRLARMSGLAVVEVQHHHAHVASVIAEHQLSGPVIGVAFDGTGYGTDGAVWGGEFLLCEGGSAARRAHLSYVTLAGGDSVAVDARKAAYCYSVAAGIPHDDAEGADLLRAALAGGVGTIRYSGMGRLFDAVASLLGICHRNGYEGQCAVLLENAAHRAAAEGLAPLPMDFALVEEDEGLVIDTLPIIRTVAEAGWAGGDTAGVAALGFHDAICRMVVAVCSRLREQDGTGTVALSGGTFQNERILSGCMQGLQAAGFQVYTNNEVPCNDGGLALGQATIAAMSRGNHKEE